MKRHSGPNGLRHLLLRTGTLAAALLLMAVGQPAASQELPPQSPPGQTVLGVACSQIQELGIDKQANLRAAAIRVGCGLEPAGSPSAVSPAPASAPALPGNVNTVTGPETFPRVTQSESFVWSSDGQTIVVTMNDSRGNSASPVNLGGVSVSKDGGATFTRLSPSPFTGHGSNFGDPNVVYNKRLDRWFANFLAAGGNCGAQGLGLWTSSDALTWTVGACAHIGSSDDRESMWVDNTPSSPFYGRMYISWNDFSTANANLVVSRSDDGVTWTAPVTLFSTAFRRNVQLTGGMDGTVFVASMDEGGGGLVNLRQNYMFRSTNGGVAWTASPGISMGAAFTGPGDSVCSTNAYFAKITPIWRHMGWGQPGVGPNSVVHYAYAGKGVNATDTGDIFYVRSTDNGLTWSAPIVLNTDQAAGGTKAQWMPSLSVTDNGDVHAYWYDRRDTTDGLNYKVYGRQSRNNGISWLPDEPVSTTLIPQPAQPDPGIQSCYAGDYNYASALGNTHYATWTDGRGVVAGVNQQDVFFASVPTKPIMCCKDANGNYKTDIVLRNSAGQVYEFFMDGISIVSSGFVGPSGGLSTNWGIVGFGDFNGDGTADILWQNNAGDLYIWLMNGLTVVGQGAPTPAPGGPAATLGSGSQSQVVGTGDFDGDGKADILLRDAGGSVFIWTMNGLSITTQTLVSSVDAAWQVAGTGYFDADGKADILWRNTVTGGVYMWLMNGASIKSSALVFGLGLDWRIAGVGDFNGDGKSDILLRNINGDVYQVWMSGFTVLAGGGYFGGVVPNTLQIVGLGDFDHFLVGGTTPTTDILWRDTAGTLWMWLLNGITIIGAGNVGTLPAEWQVE